MLWRDGQGHSFSSLCPSYLISCSLPLSLSLSLSLSRLFLPLALLYFITQAHGLWAVPRHALYLKTLCLHAWHFLLLERSLNQSLSIGILIYLAAPVLSCGMWDLAPWLGIPDQSSWIESMESYPLDHQGNPPLKFLFLVSIKLPSRPLLQLLVLLLTEIFAHSFKCCLSVYYLALILFRFSVKLFMRPNTAPY